jgi:hypothetical protein
VTEERKLAEIIARIIDSRDTAIKISPTWIAHEAMLELDPDRSAPLLVYAGCNLELRQIARGQLRGRFQPDDSEGEEHDLFPDLQRRYPTARSAAKDDPEYVLLEHLAPEDIGFNVARLRAEGRAKLKHADALEAYERSRKSKHA